MKCAVCNSTENLRTCTHCEKTLCVQHIQAYRHTSEKVAKHSNGVRCER